MKIVFVSNYFNHHQSSISEEFHKATKGQYTFIQTMPMEEERKKMGWNDAITPVYVKKSYLSTDSHSACMELIDTADVVIFGSAPEKMIKKRIRDNKLTFRYSERIYKKKSQLIQLPFRFIKYHFNNFPYSNVYLLSASAYASADYAKTFNFINKAYTWGYFPETKSYDDIEKIIRQKAKASILWCARFIDWKHPEIPVQVAKKLKDEGYQFKMTMIGDGPLFNKISSMINEQNLTENIILTGAMSPEQVRNHMEQAEIFLFTSDRNEGWGAVLNEAMNSACAVIASHEIGSVPYLLKNKENGLVYEGTNIDDIFSKTKFLLDHIPFRQNLGKKAQITIVEHWNSTNAVNRFISLSTFLQKKEEKKTTLFEEGLCSKAPHLKSKWFSKEENGKASVIDNGV